MAALSAQGYRVVAPYLKGYPPTEVSADGFYDKASLVNELIQFILSPAVDVA